MDGAKEDSKAAGLSKHVNGFALAKVNREPDGNLSPGLCLPVSLTLFNAMFSWPIDDR